VHEELGRMEQLDGNHSPRGLEKWQSGCGGGLMVALARTQNKDSTRRRRGWTLGQKDGERR
jgi:hypothetical protein